MNASAPSPTPASRIESEALEWFVRGLGGLDAQAAQALQAWMQLDPAHAAAHDRWAREWQGLDALPPWAVAKLRAGLKSTPAAAARQAPAASWWPRAAMAATSFAAIAAGCVAWDQWQQQPIYSQTFATARGQQSEVTLPDGSTLRLDTATRAEVRLYRQRREVRLPEGQAMFQVSGDPQRPFDVLAGPVRVTVVGTRFSVRYTPSLSPGEPVQVAVEHGHVRVATAGGASMQQVDLTAGQQVWSDAGGALGPVASVAPGGVAPWQQNRISFDNLPLERALAELARYGDTHFAVPDPAVGALRLTGTFDPRRLDNFARLLPQALPVQLRTSRGQTEIVAAPPH